MSEIITKSSNTTKVAVSITALLLILIAAILFYQNTNTESRAELPLNLRIGMSSSEVAETLNAEFVSLDKIKQTIHGHEYYSFDADWYLLKIGDLVITDSIKLDLTREFASVALLGERAVLAAKFYKDQLYDIEFEFDLSTPEVLSKGREIMKQLQEKYPSANLENSKEIKDAFSLRWTKDSVEGYLWVNPKDKILSLHYLDMAVFKSALEQQKSLSEKGL